MSSPREADDHLIARAAGGDRQAFGALVERHGKAVLAIGRALARGDADAEDIAQETFLSALRAASTYRPGVASVRSWLFAIARNAGRKARRTREVPSDTLDEHPPLIGLGIGAVMKSRLHRARLRLMATLCASEGAIVTNERDVGGLTCGAVLERLGEYVDRELGPTEVARVEAHLRGCTVCERFGGRYARTVHAARERLGAAHAVDDATLARVRAALGLP